MKVQIIILAGLTVGLAIGLTQWQAVTAPIMPPIMPGRLTEPTMPQSMTMDKVLMSGSFVAAEHPTAGGASVVMQDGKQYLMLDQQFKSDSGPDLYVLLHREAMPKTYAAADYVNLGKLKQLAGSQMYEIPAGMDVAAYQSAVIWCQKFNATFGYAMLK